MGYFDEELFPVVQIPKTHKNLERSIGAFLIAWNVLERELNISFPVLFRVDPTLAGCIYSNLGTKAKIEILTSALDSLSLLLGGRLAQSGQSILNRISTLNDKARNTLAHGIREPIYQDESSYWVLVRLSAKKRQSWILHEDSPKHWNRLTKAVLTASRAWHRKMRTVHSKLKKVSDEELERRVLIHSKDAEPIVLRSRNRRPPKKDGSQDHRTIREKSA